MLTPSADMIGSRSMQPSVQLPSVSGADIELGHLVCCQRLRRSATGRRLRTYSFFVRFYWQFNTSTFSVFYANGERISRLHEDKISRTKRTHSKAVSHALVARH